jgi:hypothetical protein
MRWWLARTSKFASSARSRKPNTRFEHSIGHSPWNRLRHRGRLRSGFHGRPRFTGDIDILIRPSAQNAARFDPRSAKIAGLPVNFISKEPYIRNKRAVGRPQDLADLEALS